MPASLRRRSLAGGMEFATVRVPVIVEGRIIRESGSVSLLPCCSLSIAGCCRRVSSPRGDNCSHPSRHPGQGTDGDDRSLPASESTPIMNNTSKTDVDAGFVPGDIERTWRYRADPSTPASSAPDDPQYPSRPSTTDAADSAPPTPDALETARALDECAAAASGRLRPKLFLNLPTDEPRHSRSRSTATHFFKGFGAGPDGGIGRRAGLRYQW
jgi:hypothetical protein